MIYAKRLTLPPPGEEYDLIQKERRTCFTSLYPFGLFPRKGLRAVELDHITIFCGGNGSGKSTLLNILARKLNAARYAPPNGSAFFDQYVQLCQMHYDRYPQHSQVLTSDDVFDYVLSARNVNQHIDDQRNELLDKYVATHRQAAQDHSLWRMRGLDDYDRWSETVEILSPKRSQSGYIKNRVARDIDLYSNGETAMSYFLKRIDGDGVYLLDEPENSLSVELQLQLAEYIVQTVRATSSQFIIATHSPILLAMGGALVYDLDGEPAGPCRWTEVPNVRRLYDFFAEHQQAFLKNR